MTTPAAVAWPRFSMGAFLSFNQVMVSSVPMGMGFQPTSLWNLLTMAALIGSGGGLMFRSLMAYDDGKDRQERQEPGERQDR
jgi:hypothetical protein